MEILARRQFIQKMMGIFASSLELVAHPFRTQRRTDGINIRKSAGGIEIDNGLLRAQFRQAENGLQQNYYARSSDGEWEILVQSLQSAHRYRKDVAPLYGDLDVAGEHRLLATDAFKSARVVNKTPERVIVLLDGTLHGNKIQQWVSLEPEQAFFHIEVSGVLSGDPPRLEYFLSLFEFPGGAAPDFTHVPCLPWWNNVHDAEGMYWWGKKGDSTLVDKARRIINFALMVTQKEGIFPSVYRYNEKRWVGCYWKFPDNFNSDWTFPDKWEPKVLPHFWDMSSDFYQPAAASKTGVYLLRYRRRCEDNPRILPYLRRYGDFLVEHADPSGCVPAWFTEDLKPVRELRFNAEGGIHVWFFAELYGATQDSRYLAAAERFAGFLKRKILPRQRWYDFETFYSCSIKPENFFDAYTGQWPQCTLSMLWAIDGFAALYKATRDPAHLSDGETVADYSGFFQAVWQPHFITTAYAYGGFRSQNSDAEWLDMRQACFAGAYMHLAELAHRQDLFERAIAALRASFAVIHHPRLIKNNVFRYPRYPLGIEPENIDHEGVPQDPLRSGFDWGEGGGLTAAAELLSKLGGAYIDFNHRIGVGVDGVLIRGFRLDGRRIAIDLENQLAALPFPYEKAYAIDLRLAGLLPGTYEFVLNNGEPKPIRLTASATRVRIEIGPRSVQLLSGNS